MGGRRKCAVTRRCACRALQASKRQRVLRSPGSRMNVSRRSWRHRKPVRRSCRKGSAQRCDARGAGARSLKAIITVLERFAPPVPQPQSACTRAPSSRPSPRPGRDIAIGANVTISDGATIGERCVIHPNVFIGADVTLGPDCEIWPGVVIREHCTLRRPRRRPSEYDDRRRRLRLPVLRRSPQQDPADRYGAD